MLPDLTRHLSPTTCFLLEQVCASAAAPAGEPPFTAKELLEEARRQLVAGLLYQWAERHTAHPLAAALRPQLQPLQQANTLHALQLVSETRRWVDRLAAAGIRAIAAKGPLLSRRYYGDYATRHAGDLDLLTAPEQVADADRLLCSNGYCRTKPQNQLSPRRFELYLRTQHEFGYRHPAGLLSMELHWRYADSPSLAPYSFADLWQRAERVDIAGSAIPVLSHRDTLVHLAIHGALDGWSRLKWIADLPRVVDALASAELAALQTEARGMGYARMLDLALMLAGGMNPAGTARRTQDESDWLPQVLPHILRRLTDTRPHTLAQKIGSYMQDQRYVYSIADNARIRRSLAYSNLIMPRDFDRLALPDALTAWLPYLAQCRRVFSYRAQKL